MTNDEATQGFLKEKTIIYCDILKMTYDKEADAAYISLREIKAGEVEKTKNLGSDISIDFGKNNTIIGIEILSASKNLSKKELSKAQSIYA